jgi:ABC-type phosphate transport system auxiliary subunit
MNKELNRLRNIAGVDPSGDLAGELGMKSMGTIRKSEVFGALRADLDKDAHIEHLKELVEDQKMEASMRIQDLQSTIERLRVENKRLEISSRTSAMSTMELMELKASAVANQTEKRKLQEEIDHLREKIRYIDTHSCNTWYCICV